MRNWYNNRPYIVVCAPVAEKRGRTFEHKLAKAKEHGFQVVGCPTFHLEPTRNLIIGTVLLQKRGQK